MNFISYLYCKIETTMKETNEEAKIRKLATYHRNKYKFNGMSRQMIASQRRNSIRRDHPKPAYTLGEFREWLLDNSFSILYDKFIESNYDTWLIPSVDRINDDLPYTFDNIQLITWRENWEKGMKSNKTRKRKRRKRLGTD